MTEALGIMMSLNHLLLGLDLTDRARVIQSTYCDNVRQHCETVGRTIHVVNLGELSLPCLDFSVLGGPCHDILDFFCGAYTCILMCSGFFILQIQQQRYSTTQWLLTSEI